LRHVKLSANWMAACSAEGQDASLYAAVRAVGEELCPALDITIPVGKDSMSMRTVWDDGKKSVVSPVSLIVSAFAKVKDVRRSLTPQLQTEADSQLVFVDLGRGKNRMGLSAFAQVSQQVGEEVPDVDSASDLKAFFETVQSLNQEGRIMAYHDRSDGGLFATLVEMCFAGRIGATIDLLALRAAGKSAQELLFSEELGAILQVTFADVGAVLAAFAQVGLADATCVLGTLRTDDHVVVMSGGEELLRESRVALRRAWSATSHQMQKLRDNPETAAQEYDALLDATDPGLCPSVPFDVTENVARALIERQRNAPK
jgi:phosphoribosylformylglycinamidine synthase